MTVEGRAALHPVLALFPPALTGDRKTSSSTTGRLSQTCRGGILVQKALMAQAYAGGGLHLLKFLRVHEYAR